MVHTYRRLMVPALIYRIVICLTMAALLDAPDPDSGEVAPGFFSNSFQNFKLSSAAVRHTLAFFFFFFSSADPVLTYQLSPAFVHRG